MLNTPINITDLTLQRYPKTFDKSLKAWCSADQLLVDFVFKDNICNDTLLNENNNQTIKTLIVNDQFGAISTCLNDLAPSYWTDSYLSNQAIQSNLIKNHNLNVKATPLNWDSMDCPQTLKPELFDLLLFRIPKHNSLLQYQLNQIKPLLSPNVKIVGAGMTKDIHNSNLAILEQTFGITTTSLASKKARLIYCEFTNKIIQEPDIQHYRVEDENLIVMGLPGVFSREKLDIGTQVMMNYLPELAENDHAIDLGCGNGVIGAVLAKRYPRANILLTDESEVAIESARQTFKVNNLTNGCFLQTNVLENVTQRNFTHILCNPPFHQQNVQTLDIAHKMFKDSALRLKPDGQLRVVANRHLQYQPMLKKYFNQVNSISKDSKFTVWLATHPKA